MTATPSDSAFRYLAVHDRGTGRHVVVRGRTTDELLADMHGRYIQGDLSGARAATPDEIRRHEETRAQFPELYGEKTEERNRVAAVEARPGEPA